MVILCYWNYFPVSHYSCYLNDLPDGFKCPEGREKPWGTAHAILAARDLINEDFIIINGDDFYGFDAYKVAAEYLKSLPKDSEGKYANVAFKVSNTMTENGAVKRGVLFQDKNGNLDRLVESKIMFKKYYTLLIPILLFV